MSAALALPPVSAAAPAPQVSPLELLGLLRAALLAEVRQDDARDLSTRQLAALTLIATTPGPHTVRGLAEALNVGKPAITRAHMRLGELYLVTSQPEPGDRRGIVLHVTTAGLARLARMVAAMEAA